MGCSVSTTSEFAGFTKLEDLETERTLMVEMKNSFDACWRSINFGEKAWSAYIDFCAGKAAMDPRMWSFAFFQVRKRFLKFLSDRPSHAEAVQHSDQKPTGVRGPGLGLPVQRRQLGAGAPVHLRGPGPPPVAGGGQG